MNWHHIDRFLLLTPVIQNGGVFVADSSDRRSFNERANRGTKEERKQVLKRAKIMKQ
jgi:hypothetical protein